MGSLPLRGPPQRKAYNETSNSSSRSFPAAENTTKGFHRSETFLKIHRQYLIGRQEKTHSKLLLWCGASRHAGSDRFCLSPPDRSWDGPCGWDGCSNRRWFNVEAPASGKWYEMLEKRKEVERHMWESTEL